MKMKCGKIDQKQQGDVLLQKITDLPLGLKPVSRKARGYVLADGEVTGHAHVIDVAEGGIELFEDGTGRLFMQTDHPVTVKHEEHGPIQLDAGIWQINRVREMDHVRQAERQVAD